MSENDHTAQITTDAETRFAEEIENMARPLYEKIQSLPESERKNLQIRDILTHNEASQRQNLLFKIFDYIRKSSRFKQIDGFTCVEVLDDALKSYQGEKYEGPSYQDRKLSFWKYFCNVYRKRIAPYEKQPAEEIGLPDQNYEFRGQKVKDYLRLLAKKSRLTEEEAAALELSEERSYYAKESNALRILEQLGYGADTPQARDAKKLLSDSYIVNHEALSQGEGAEEVPELNKLARPDVERKTPGLEFVAKILDRAVEKAERTGRVNVEYLKGFVTLYVLSTQDELLLSAHGALSEEISRHIIAPFYEEHRRKRYSAGISPSTVNRMQKQAMAEYLGLQPETWRKTMKRLSNYLMQFYPRAGT